MLTVMQNKVSESSQHRLSPKAARLSWLTQLITAVILGQTLFFKFAAAPESVAIFETLGAEPWGRWASGFAELIAVLLLMRPQTAVFGGLLSLGVISGAIFSHLTVLGIEVGDDGGALFGMAIAVFVASAITVWLRRKQIPLLGSRF
jgi:putative oxidoreductase